MNHIVAYCSEKVKVFFWNELAIEFENALHTQEQHPVIVIISCARVSKNHRNGVNTISNMTPTTFFLNGNSDKIHLLRNRYIDDTQAILH